MKLKNKKVKVLCSNCKTGEESYLVDPSSFACPYFSCIRDFKCDYYVPINDTEEAEVGNKEGFFKKLISRFKRNEKTSQI